jgi:hypothetical protein
MPILLFISLAKYLSLTNSLTACPAYCYIKERADKLELNKIAARWPAKAVTQRFCSIQVYQTPFISAESS